jgi:hypothetical protein
MKHEGSITQAAAVCKLQPASPNSIQIISFYATRIYCGFLQGRELIHSRYRYRRLENREYGIGDPPR